MSEELTILHQLTKQIEMDNISSSNSDDIQHFDDEFYEIINDDGMIDGPYDLSGISNIFLTHFRKHSFIEPTLWLRPCKKTATWYKVHVLYLMQHDSNVRLCVDDNTFFTVCGNLVTMLQKLKNMQIHYASDYPKEFMDESNGSCSSFFHIIAVIINYGLFLFGLIHIHILICFFCLVQYNKSINKMPKCVAFLCISIMIMAIFTSCAVSYSLIYFEYYDDIQSWMIAYIAWISIQWIEEGAIRILFAFGRSKVFFGYDSFRLNLLGIQFRRKNDLIEANGMHNCWIPPIFALLPASLIGFITNYFLDEQFILDCDNDLIVGDVCYDDGRGCCIVVSSYDYSSYETMLDFFASLTSNIIAVYGIIRIIAWFMVTKTKQYRGMAQKSQ